MNALVKQKFDSYPSEVLPHTIRVRQTIFDVAKAEMIGTVTESLKWNEPSYHTKHGSTVRIDWKSHTPDRYFVYFHCRTTLIETFKELYQDIFQFDGNRAISFSISDELPERELKHCLSMALRYHQIKHLPLLGASFPNSLG